jgi:hypothetical protein
MTTINIIRDQYGRNRGICNDFPIEILDINGWEWLQIPVHDAGEWNFYSTLPEYETKSASAGIQFVRVGA